MKKRSEKSWEGEMRSKETVQGCVKRKYRNSTVDFFLMKVRICLLGVALSGGAVLIGCDIASAATDTDTPVSGDSDDNTNAIAYETDFTLVSGQTGIYTIIVHDSSDDDAGYYSVSYAMGE